MDSTLSSLIEKDETKQIYQDILNKEKEDFNKTLIQIFLQYRMLTGFFAIFPYITLLIINPL
jgi:hypothetical protein